MIVDLKFINHNVDYTGGILQENGTSSEEVCFITIELYIIMISENVSWVLRPDWTVEAITRRSE